MSSSSPRETFRRLVRNVRCAPRRALGRALTRRRGPFWILLEIDDPTPRTAFPLPGAARPRNWTRLLRALATATHDPDVAGVFLRTGSAVPGFARAATLHRSLRTVAAKKPVVAYGESFSMTQYWVASAATRTLMPESGMIALGGLFSEHLYLRSFLDRLGVRAERLHVGAYKSAGETLVREGMSEEQREQIEALHEDWMTAIASGIANARGLEETQLRKLLGGGPLLARDAQRAGLLDRRAFPDEIDGELQEQVPSAVRNVGGEVRARVLPLARYARMTDAERILPLDGPVTRIAVVSARGPIVRESPRVAFAAPMQRIVAKTFCALLERLRGTPTYDAVLIQLDSPGGDALASDLLWRSVMRLRERRPVVVSIGEVAASGGYFLAAGANAIVAEASALTGSIGVVGGKLDLSGLWERLGVIPDAVGTGERAGMYSSSRAFSPDERASLRETMRAIYEIFLDRVAEGRGQPRAELESLASGRVWSGARAKEHALVDALGGPLEALEIAAGLLERPDGAPIELDFITSETTPWQFLRGRFSSLS